MRTQSDGVRERAETSVRRLHKLLQAEALAAQITERHEKREEAERRLEASIELARHFGVSWRAIGCQIGMTGSGAHKRYGAFARVHPVEDWNAELPFSGLPDGRL